ncbi:MAG: carbohydrate ABC transporter permease, partial [Enterococcus faecium]
MHYSKEEKNEKKKVERVQVRSFNKTANFFSNIMIALFAISCILP